MKGDWLCIEGTSYEGGGIVEDDQVDHTVLGTVGPCILKVLLLALKILHCNIQKQKSVILMGKRELVALLNLSSWCLVMVERLFLAVPLGCLRFVIVVFPDHTHLLFLTLT